MTEPLDNLASLKPGEKAVIISFLDEDLSLKLLEMGCTPGEEVEVEKIAPFGDLRRAEASTVQIRKIVLDN